MAEVKLTARAKAFAGEGIKTHRMLVDCDARRVAVWDTVAGHYTTCHSLSPATIRRIIAAVRTK